MFRRGKSVQNFDLVKAFYTKKSYQFSKSGGRNWRLIFNFLAETLLACFWRENFKGIHFEFVAQNVARGNPVQILSNFPAKSLSI